MIRFFDTSALVKRYDRRDLRWRCGAQMAMSGGELGSWQAHS
jgi:hypothetical protein